MLRRTLIRTSCLLIATASTPFLQGCDSGGGITDVGGSSTVTISVNGLEPITGGLNYQAWLVHGTGGSTYGFPLVIFNIDDQGRMVDPVADTVLTGPYQADVDPGEVQGIAISLELSNQLLEFSSFTFILSGELSQGTVNLTAEDFFALNRDFSDVTGKFGLFTPTDDDPGNEFSGVWFVDPSTSPVQPGLFLPQSPNGWVYEGWVEVDGKAVSTGKFEWAVDSDSTSYYSGPLEAPTFPGEDFLFNPPQGVTFPLDLAGATVFISLEPFHQWDVYPEDPFYLRILQTQVPANPVASAPYQMTLLRSQLPTGTATVQ